MRNVTALAAAVGLLAFISDAAAYDGRNAGVFNAGVFNAGVFNTDVNNAGVFNTGVFNAGVFNAGVFNAGVFNAGVFNAGVFNTVYMQGSSLPAPATTKSGAVTQGQWQYLGAYPVTAGRTFTVNMTGTGDADLYVKFGNSDYRTYNCRPYASGSIETCSVTVPADQNTAFVSVNGYAATSSSFTATIGGFDGFGAINNGFLNPGTATNTRMRGAGTLTGGQIAELGEFPVTAGSVFRVHMTGTSDADLYVRFGGAPSDSAFDCRPYTGSSTENCDVTVPTGATLAYVSVRGYSSSSTFAVDVLDFKMGLGGMTSSQGYTIDNVSLNGSALSGSTWSIAWGTECEEPYGCWETYYQDYTSVGPWGFTGATMQSTVTDDDQRVVGTVSTRIANVHAFYATSTEPETTYTYDVEAYLGARDASGNTTWAWYPLCGKDSANNMIGAVPLQGTWNYQSGALHGGRKIGSSANQITWACLNGALGKAAAAHNVTLPNGMGTGYGYKPWMTQNVWYKESTYHCGTNVAICYWTSDWVIHAGTAATAHQAATRMIRADYCGDGMAHTIAGRHLDVWDMLPNKINTKGVNYTPEASWHEGGANDFISCNPRVDELWARDCQPGQVYCDMSCPQYQYDVNGQTYTSTPHKFDQGDDGSYRCLTGTSYASGTGFNKNELVNTNETTGGWIADKSFAASILRR